jgi:hypothetical protein
MTGVCEHRLGFEKTLRSDNATVHSHGPELSPDFTLVDEVHFLSSGPASTPNSYGISKYNIVYMTPYL